MSSKQVERVIGYIDENGSITAMQAMNDLGVMRLAAVIFDAKRDGYEIEREMVGVTNRYGEKCSIAKYRMVEHGAVDKD